MADRDHQEDDGAVGYDGEPLGRDRQREIDQRIAESTEDFAAGRSYAPFESAEAMVTSRRGLGARVDC